MPKQRLKEGQRTIIVGVRMPSSMEYALRKAARKLVSEGYEVTKSELVRYLVEEHVDDLDKPYKKKHPFPPPMEAR